MTIFHGDKRTTINPTIPVCSICELPHEECIGHSRLRTQTQRVEIATTLPDGGVERWEGTVNIPGPWLKQLPLNVYLDRQKEREKIKGEGAFSVFKRADKPRDVCFSARRGFFAPAG